MDNIKENIILNGDCLKLMEEISDKSVDMILCDLPYGTTSAKWDSIINLEELWKHYKRIIKNNSPIVLTSCQPFTSKLITSNIDWFKYDWVWDKHIPRNFINAKIMPMQKHESVLVFGKGKINYYPIMTKRDKPIKGKNYNKNKDSVYKLNQNGTDGKVYTYTHKNPNTIIVGCWENNKDKIHPTQKPVSLFEYLIKTYTKEGDLVLDNCAGSGTTAIACLNLNRKYILIEQDIEYFNKMKERINKHIETIK